MNYIFRRVQMKDRESIWALFQELKEEKIDMSFAEVSHMEEILAYIDNPAELTYVAASLDQPHKVLCLVKGRREMTTEKRHAVFLSAATLKEARGNGLAVKLTEFALAEMKKEGVTIARIYVYSNNSASLHAIGKMDFIHAGTVLRHHKDPSTGAYIDDLIYHKILE
ncbi:GNAT family N-acetyltransferase [Proteiniclasticum sp. SCR006]|uniref:GNAT family N-acetyltransferase n=1 Tax=Proteiniclasticum aestuarii TaxID=2817862 RepID=A0A939HE53_9CLOT|nr:GNAT family N-acetyltransferase [Proteiniclasticum aestuarii]MBO1265895.1 GNAT family N-acetyltransferase [Proteiniclasticum aestuarii]